MKKEIAHLDFLLPKVRTVLELEDKERIIFIQKAKWVPYPTANNILDQLDLLLTYPKKSRMPGMLIVGETNNGKTSLINKFLSMNKPVRGEDWEETTEIHVISALAPSSPNVSDLYSSILEQFAVPYKNSDKTAKKEQQIKYYFGLCNLKILIIDEINNILSGPIGKQKVFMNAIKNLSTSLQIPIVLSGVKEALRATNTDNQINNRFKPVFLPKWQYNKDYLSMLASLEQITPLKKPSKLAQTQKTAEKILDLSEGYIGEMVDLISAASIYAIRSGSERITADELNSCGFVQPSHRKDYEDFVLL